MLGDLIHDALELVGITSSRVSYWLGAPCNCEERQQKLNQLTLWAKRVLLGKSNRAHIEELLREPEERQPMRTVGDLVNTLPSMPGVQLAKPACVLPPGVDSDRRSLVGMAVESMKRHTTDEGWQIFAGLEHAGYNLAGLNCKYNCTDTSTILTNLHPTTVVVQDKREWDGQTSGPGHNPAERFHGTGLLAQRPDIFRLTILKDAQSRYEYTRQASVEIGCHAWIVYYHPSIVGRLCPYVRPEHIIRTWHTVDSDLVPTYTKERRGVLLSGAVSGVYPLRQRLFNEARLLPDTSILRHPGYQRRGCYTPAFLQALTKFKVAICTASKFGYALRKIVEATACGCIVLTDLPDDEIMPEIDGNLVRVRPETPTREVANTLRRLLDNYDPSRQEHYSLLARNFYDYRPMGVKLATDIESLRVNYNIG